MARLLNSGPGLSIAQQMIDRRRAQRGGGHGRKAVNGAEGQVGVANAANLSAIAPPASAHPGGNVTRGVSAGSATSIIRASGLAPSKNPTTLSTTTAGGAPLNVVKILPKDAMTKSNLNLSSVFSRFPS